MIDLWWHDHFHHGMNTDERTDEWHSQQPSNLTRPLQITDISLYLWRHFHHFPPKQNPISSSSFNIQTTCYLYHSFHHTQNLNFFPPGHQDDLIWWMTERIHSSLVRTHKAHDHGRFDPPPTAVSFFFLDHENSWPILTHIFLFLSKTLFDYPTNTFFFTTMMTTTWWTVIRIDFFFDVMDTRWHAINQSSRTTTTRPTMNNNALDQIAWIHSFIAPTNSTYTHTHNG